MDQRMKIALVADEQNRLALVEWVRLHAELLGRHDLYATGMTGQVLERELGLPVITLGKGEVVQWSVRAATSRQARFDLLIFLRGYSEPGVHAADERALLRLATQWNIPVACNRASADYLVTSPLLAPARPPAGSVSDGVTAVAM